MIIVFVGSSGIILGSFWFIILMSENQPFDVPFDQNHNLLDPNPNPNDKVLQNYILDSNLISLSTFIDLLATEH